MEQGTFEYQEVAKTHLKTSVELIQGDRFQIGNNIGRINGWISKNSIFGICVKIEA